MKNVTDAERFGRYQAVVNLLLTKDSFYKPEIYKALKETLEIQPNDLLVKFTEKNLRRVYNKGLADIISIIRHAAQGGELLTTEQRVNKALMKVKSDRAFTKEHGKRDALK